MTPLRRSAASAAGLLLACLALLALVPGCSAPEDGYARLRPSRASLADRVSEDVQAMQEGMRRARILR